MKKLLECLSVILICGYVSFIEINAEEELSQAEEVYTIEFHLAEKLDYVQWGNGYEKETDIGTLEFTSYLVSDSEKENLVTQDIFPQVLFTEKEQADGWKVAGYGYWNTDWVFVPVGGFDDAIMTPPTLSMAGSGYTGISGLVIYIIQDKIGEGEGNRIDLPDGIDDRNERVIRFLDWDGSLINAQVVETESRLVWTCADDYSWCDNVELAKLYVNAPTTPIRKGREFDHWDKEFENVRFYEDIEIKAVYAKGEEFYISVPKIITLDGNGKEDSYFVVGIKGVLPKEHSIHISMKGMNEQGYFDLYHIQDKNINASTRVFFINEDNEVMKETFINDQFISEENYTAQINGKIERCKFPFAGSYVGKFSFLIEVERT